MPCVYIKPGNFFLLLFFFRKEERSCPLNVAIRNSSPSFLHTHKREGEKNMMEHLPVINWPSQRSDLIITETTWDYLDSEQDIRQRTSKLSFEMSFNKPGELFLHTTKKRQESLYKSVQTAKENVRLCFNTVLSTLRQAFLSF